MNSTCASATVPQSLLIQREAKPAGTDIVSLLRANMTNITNAPAQFGTKENARPDVVTQIVSRPNAVPSPKVDEHTSRMLDALLVDPAGRAQEDTGQSIDRISGTFLGTPYGPGTLIGSATLPEELVVNFLSMDCLTFLEYVEALRRSITKESFILRLIETRYVRNEVNFLRRKHFFTDWAHVTHPIADDVAGNVSKHSQTTEKKLNQKDIDETYIPGLPVVERPVTYIPARFIDRDVVERLQTGDYIGIYAPQAGLDVSHVGIFVVTDHGPMLRHTSSIEHRVSDSPFIEYVEKKTGIVVLRPRHDFALRRGYSQT